MTSGQVRWVAAVKALARQKPMKAPKPPESGWRLHIYALVSSRTFDVILTLVIVANIIVMAGDYWGIEESARDVLIYERAMNFFCYIYYVEATLKICALGVRGCALRPPSLQATMDRTACSAPHAAHSMQRPPCSAPHAAHTVLAPKPLPGSPLTAASTAHPTDFSDSWCRFDFFLVCTALLDQFATELLASYLPIPPMMLRILRIFRVMRLFRLLKGEHARGLRDLLVTMQPARDLNPFCPSRASARERAASVPPRGRYARYAR